MYEKNRKSNKVFGCTVRNHLFICISGAGRCIRRRAEHEDSGRSDLDHDGKDESHQGESVSDAASVGTPGKSVRTEAYVEQF